MAEKVDSKIGVSSSGSKFYIPVDYKYSEEDKCFIPIEGKKFNRYEMIQASKGSCDINYIVKRALAGDNTALNVRVPQYADVSEVPDNLNDLHEMNIEAINNFSKLDPNIKKLFNNDLQTFVNALSDGSYLKVINDAFSSKEEVKQEIKQDAKESEASK